MPRSEKPARTPSGSPIGLWERIVWSLVLLAVCAACFRSIDSRNATHAIRAYSTELLTPLDAYVPFVPEFIFAYLLYYPWVLSPVVVIRERTAFARAVAAFAWMQLIASTVYIWLPSHMIRPTVSGSGLAAELTRWLFSADAGWNVFPSLHVGHSTLVALLFARHAPRYLPIVLSGTLLISLSTVLVKQHYVVDAPAGVALACVSLWISDLQLPDLLGCDVSRRDQRWPRVMSVLQYLRLPNSRGRKP